MALYCLSLLVLFPIAVDGRFARIGTFWFYVQVAAGLFIVAHLAIVIVGSRRHYKRLKAEKAQAKKDVPDE